MEKKQIEGKIFDLQEKLEICEIALDINEDEELEPAWKDMIKAYKEHIADLEEFLKLFAIPDVSVSFSAKEMENFAAYMLIQHNGGNKKKTYEHLQVWLANEAQ